MKAVGARLPLRRDGAGHRTDHVRRRRPRSRDALGEGLRHRITSLGSRSSTRASRGDSGRPHDHHGTTSLNVYGHLSGLGVPGDEPLLAEDEVRYKGQPIAVVAAEAEELAQAGVEAIEIAYEEREPIFDMQSLRPRVRADPSLGAGLQPLRAS